MFEIFLSIYLPVFFIGLFVALMIYAIHRGDALKGDRSDVQIFLRARKAIALMPIWPLVVIAAGPFFIRKLILEDRQILKREAERKAS